MKDLVGNELKKGDLVALKLDHIVGRIVDIQGGSSIVALPDANAQSQPPTILVAVQMNSVRVSPNGYFADLVKVQTPEEAQ